MKKSRIALYVVCFFVLAVVGGLMITAITLYLKERSFEFRLIRTETVYVILILAVLLPALITAFIFIILKRKTSVMRVTDDTPAEERKPESAAESMLLEGEEESEIGSDSESGERFPSLLGIDENSEKYAREDYDESITLKTLCENLRNFAANAGLYYDIEDIRRFIAGLSVSHIMILQGMSGTGKTSLAYVFGKFLDNQSTVIPVQPMWKERTDLLGYYNEFTKQFNETVLLEKMYEALYSKDMYITVLDEMNIARVEYYFAEFLSILELPESEGRYLTVVSSMWDRDPKLFKDGKIKLPDNMWFIGTANNDDSTFAISDKVYDRAMIMNLDNKAMPFTAAKESPVHIRSERFDELSKAARKEYRMTKRNEKRLEMLDRYMIEHFGITFGNRIMGQIRRYIPVYVACGGDELEALDDILAKKVLRKVETQNPIYIKNSAEGYCRYLDELFGEENMKMCKEAMRKYANNS